MAARKSHATTQKFTEIVDIIDNVVVLASGNACMVIEVTANNFSLLSQQEQESRIYSYAALLNSITFPIQILIRNKRIDISTYIKELDEAEKNTKNDLLVSHIQLYRAFIKEMVKVNVVLSKSFYVAISYSSLEAGVGGLTKAGKKGQAQVEAFGEAAKRALQNKAVSLLSELQKFTISAKILEKEDLIKLFYDIYNDDVLAADQAEESAGAAMVTTNKV